MTNLDYSEDYRHFMDLLKKRHTARRFKPLLAVFKYCIPAWTWSCQSLIEGRMCMRKIPPWANRSRPSGFMWQARQ